MTEACSYYLSDEAANLRIAALTRKLASEVVNLGPAGVTFPPDSAFWKVPMTIQVLVLKENLDAE